MWVETGTHNSPKKVSGLCKSDTPLGILNLTFLNISKVFFSLQWAHPYVYVYSVPLPAHINKNMKYGLGRKHRQIVYLTSPATTTGLYSLFFLISRGCCVLFRAHSCLVEWPPLISLFELLFCNMETLRHHKWYTFQWYTAGNNLIVPQLPFTIWLILLKV